MSARGTCQIINGTAATKTQQNTAITLRKVDEETTSKPECRCHFSVKKKSSKKLHKKSKKPQQIERLHSLKRKQRKANANMQPQQHLQQQQQYLLPLQQHTKIQQMAFVATSDQHTVVTMPTAPIIDTSKSHTSLDTDVTSDNSSYSSSLSSVTTDGCSSTKPTNNTPSIGVNLRVTGQCSQGGRKYMEDYFSVAYQQSENAKDLEYAFVGIYDGHGGAEAATFAKEHLMMEIINQKLFWSDSDHDVLRAIREGYIATHYAMWREQEKWPKTANGLPSTAGTTATIAFIRREKIYIGHVGDSGIVLGYQNENEHFWRAQQLTTDHKPESLAERTRITRSGGKVVIKSGVPRVVWNRPRNAGHKGPIRRNTLVDEIPFLAVARSLGDLWSYNSACNEFIVSPDPDVKVIKINPNTFRCLIFGTDGLWNVVTPQEAVNTVYEKESINEGLQVQRGESPSEGVQWTNPSKGLVEQALKTWSSKKMRADNTSVVTVILYPPCSTETSAETGGITPVATSSQLPVLQPSSYGLEYTQLHAEINTYEDATTYHEMAEKYLPPEEYRNFNYYADDEDAKAEFKLTPEEVATIDPLILKYNRTGYMVWRNMEMRDKTVYTGSGSGSCSNEWNWAPHQHLYTALTSNATTAELEAIAEDDGADGGNDESADDDTDEEEGETVEHANDVSDSMQHDGEPAAEDMNASSFQNYVPCPALMGENANGGGYMNSFAESYNCLLSEHMVQENASTSNSSNQPAYQSISGSSMHEILQEQQLYQQQCMSEEDGYSLTKLETRREQQRCRGVQTFKIFQQSQGTSTEPNYIRPAAATASTKATAEEENDNDEPAGAVRATGMRYYWNPTECPTISTAANRYLEYEQHKQHLHLQQQHLILQQQQQQQEQEQEVVAAPVHKPLELNSLLEREREEEQQVALERLEMQRQMVDATTATSTTITNSESVQTTSEVVLKQTHAYADEPPLVEEYLEEEEDETVQINEVSSSSTMDIGDVEVEVPTTSTAAVEHMQVDEEALIEAMEIEEIKIDTPTPTLHEETAGAPAAGKSLVIEQIEQIVILRDKPAVPAISKQSKALSQRINNNVNGIALLLPSPPNAKHTQQHYPNIPNENKQQQHLLPCATHALYKLRCSATSFANDRPPAASTSNNTLQKRELRSRNASITMDYSKRTLRTRNSLSKELKAKTSLTTTLKRSASVSTQFLRTTAASLLGGSCINGAKPTSMSASNVTQVSAAVVCSRSNDGNGGSRKSKLSKMAILKSHHQHLQQQQQQQQPQAVPYNAINLRSRQVVSNNSSKNVVTASASNSCLSATSKLPVLRRERRNLRSGTTAKEAVAPSMNYSKSTRLQAAGNTLAAPPPSPKLMNAAAAVAAATRARSLVAAKNCLAASSVFDKRTILRSNGGDSELNGANAADVGATTATTATRNSRVVRRHKR